jgi:hypothetical protein
MNPKTGAHPEVGAISFLEVTTTMPVCADSYADQWRRDAARIIARMAEKRLTLRICHTKSGSSWALSDGTPVPTRVALCAVNDVRLTSNNDGLFPGVPQSWTYNDPSM